MICNFDNIQKKITTEGLNLLVVSYGGSCSNILVNCLEANKFVCKTEIWHKFLCHCPKYIECDIPIIYIYDNPIKSFISMKNRGDGYWDVNQQKLTNNKDVELSDENLLKSMIEQFNSWTSVKKNNVLILKSCELFKYDIVNKLETFLNKKITNFPIEYQRPKTNVNNISNQDLLALFEKYKCEIDKINNFLN